MNIAISNTHILASSCKNDEIVTRKEMQGAFYTTSKLCPFSLKKLKTLVPNLDNKYYEGKEKVVPILFYCTEYDNNDFWKELLELL